MLWKRIVVGDQERVLMAKNGRWKGIFLPGEYRVFAAPGVCLETEKHNVRDLVFRSKWADYLVKEQPQIAERHFTLVETSERQVGMVYVDGRLFTVLTPAKRVLFWRGQAEVRAELVEVIAEPEVTSEMLVALEASTRRRR